MTCQKEHQGRENTSKIERSPGTQTGEAVLKLSPRVRLGLLGPA